MMAIRTISFSKIWLLSLIIVVFASFTAEAGLISGLSKLGKTVKNIDAPDVHLTPFHFTDELAHYPKGSVAEINYSFSQNKWMAKTPDGTSMPIDEFANKAINSGQQPTFLISEKNIPSSDHIFNRLPADVQIKIKGRQGKTFELITNDYPPALLYQNIKVTVKDSASLKTALWQLQRPISSPKLRFVQLSDKADIKLPEQNYGSKITIDKVGANELLSSISKLRQETLVLSGKIEDGMLVHGKQKVSLADLEKTAADRDVSLVFLESENPKKTLKQLTKNWQDLSDKNALLSYSVGDFYNTFAPKNAQSVLPINIESSGKFRTSLFFDHTSVNKQVQQQSFDSELVSFPLHVLVHSVKVFQPNEERTNELDSRIFPTIDSSVHILLILSFLTGVFTVHTAWFLYTKIWTSPYKDNYSSRLLFIFTYIIHRITFLVLYLPLLGFIGPIYLVIKWTYWLINLLFIRPTMWVFNKF